MAIETLHNSKWLRTFTIPTTSYVLWTSILGLLPLSVLGEDHIIDDMDSNIRYSGSWEIGQTCPGCRAQPDPSQVNGGSWHDTTYSTPRILEYDFTGTAVSVYGILANTLLSPTLFTTTVDLSFMIDGNKLGAFSHSNDGTESYQYNQELFTTSGLSDTQHTLRVELGVNSMLLFDYLKYTSSDPVATSQTDATTSTTPSTTPSTTTPTTTPTTTTPSSQQTLPPIFTTPGLSSQETSLSLGNDTNTGAVSSSSQAKSISGGEIAGITIGAIVCITLCAILLLFLWRRVLRKERLKEVTPVMGGSNIGALSPVNEGSQHFFSEPTSMGPKRRIILEQNQSRFYSDPHLFPQHQLRQDGTVGTMQGIEESIVQESSGSGNRPWRRITRLGMSDVTPSVAETAPPPYYIPPSVSSHERTTSSSAYTSGK